MSTAAAATTGDAGNRDKSRTAGKVWLVGAGPGDPALITVRGRALLETAAAVVWDRLAAPALRDYCGPACEHHDAGKAHGGQGTPQQDTNDLLVRLARQGKRVVRLKGGDPFVFGRGGEEALALAEAGVAWEVVPGVSSAIAAAAYAGIPVTHRGLARSFAVVAGHDGLEPHGGVLAETLVVLMAVEQLEAVVGRLMALGRPADEGAALIEAATTPRQRTVTATLGTLVAAARRERVAAPAALVVGPTVCLGARLAWCAPDGSAA